jgi:hypothetical protein
VDVVVVVVVATAAIFVDVFVACFVRTADSETASKPYYTGRH